MNFITLSSINIYTEHICCAMSGKKNQAGIKAKKEWLCARMQEGLVFKKLDERGKVFIEYLPAERAWVPIEAAGYLFINCHWVAGSFKGKGYGRRLLEFCEADARSMNGVVLISSAIKKPYLSDKAFYHPAPVTTYSVFADGAFISNEILTPAKLKALIARQQSVPLVQD